MNLSAEKYKKLFAIGGVYYIAYCHEADKIPYIYKNGFANIGGYAIRRN